VVEQFLWDKAQRVPGPAPGRGDVYDQWLSFIERHIYRCFPEKGEAEASNLHARSRSFAGFTMARLGSTTAGKFQLRRDSAGIARDSRDQYALHLSLRGRVAVSQFGREQWIEPGSYTFFSASEPTLLSKTGGDETILFLMPREFVEQRVVDAERICVRPCVFGNGLQSLVFETACAFERNAWHMSDAEFQKSSHVMADLTLLALSDTADLLSGERSVRASNLARVKRIVRQRLADPDLTLSCVAAEASLSLSYVHELFRHEGEGCTLREYLKNARLQRARELLELSSPRKMTITAICLESGFSNMSQFSTAFKNAFGVSPRELLRGH